METHTNLEHIPAAPTGRAVALGTFDGVHMGHRQVIARARAWAAEHGARSAVVTFDPHPLRVLRPDDAPRLLTTTPIKLELIAALAVDEAIVIPFTDELSRMSAEDFCADVLAGRIGARHVTVGENFRFGHRAAGDAQMLLDRAEFSADVVSLVEVDGEPVSSSRIRELVAAGDVSVSSRLLGHPYVIEGEVVQGDARGRDLGMPTANLEPPPDVVLPAPGVYAATALGRPAAVSIGARPTFERDGRLLVEAYLLDFEGDLYGQRLQIGFLERLRDELSFDSVDELVEQMRRDVDDTRRIAAPALAADL
jgi:riboflavin kinase/FMN adenylyltransferase